MTATLPTNPAEAFRTLAELLRPDTLADGCEPEGRVVHHGLSWERYLAFDKARGDDCPNPRLYYLDGDLEIMSASDEHERIKTYLGGLIEDFFFETGTEIIPRGNATMWLAPKQAGAEPDASWCLGEAKAFPDLVLEIALTSGGVSKLALYQRFAVPEVWIWRRDRLEVHALRADGSGYERREAGSGLLPRLDTALLERCVALPSWLAARKAFRAGLAAGR